MFYSIFKEVSNLQNQYEKIFKNFCHELIDMSPEERYCFLTSLGFEITLAQCQAMGNRDEMINKMKELVSELQDPSKIYIKTKSSTRNNG